MEGLVLIVPGIIIAIIAFKGLFVVRQQSAAIVERFGKFLRVVEPGLHFCIPIVDKVVTRLDLRLRQLDVHVETKTKDNVFLRIIVAVQYQPMASNVYDAYYKLSSPAEQIQSFVFDVVRARVPSIELDDVFAKKDEIALVVQHELHDTMAGLGYEIMKALVTDIQPNESVKNAMNEIITAQRMRMAAQERAEAEKIVKIKQAEAEAEANILQGKGIAGQRQAIIEGLGQAVDDMRKQIPESDAKDIMTMILMLQYFDTLREVGGSSKSNTVFVSQSPQQVTDVAKELKETLFAVKLT